MTEVCHVLGVTREGVRLWKNQLRKDGLKGLIKNKMVGKRSKLTKEKLIELKNTIKKSPEKIGYSKSMWTGSLIKDYVKNTWGFEISLRTAQLWLSKVK
jgi:transposase